MWEMVRYSSFPTCNHKMFNIFLTCCAGITAEPKTPGVPWCFEFFVPNIKHKGTPRILSKLLKPRTSLVFRGVLKPTKFFMS